MNYYMIDLDGMKYCRPKASVYPLEPAKWAGG